MEEKARSVGKALTTDAVLRLIEIVGCDLRRMDNEIEKLAVYVDDKKTIDAADVDQATAWVREFDSYELDNALGESKPPGVPHRPRQSCSRSRQNACGHSPQTRGLFPEYPHGPERSFGRRAPTKKRSSNGSSRISRRLSGTLTQEKCAGFFSLVEGISESDLARLLKELENVDVLIKSSDAEAQRLFEVFLYRYCRLRKKSGDHFEGFGVIFATWRLSLDL